MDYEKMQDDLLIPANPEFENVLEMVETSEISRLVDIFNESNIEVINVLIDFFENTPTVKILVSDYQDYQKVFDIVRESTIYKNDNGSIKYSVTIDYGNFKLAIDTWKLKWEEDGE